MRDTYQGAKKYTHLHTYTNSNWNTNPYEHKYVLCVWYRAHSRANSNERATSGWCETASSNKGAHDSLPTFGNKREASEMRERESIRVEKGSSRSTRYKPSRISRRRTSRNNSHNSQPSFREFKYSGNNRALYAHRNNKILVSLYRGSLLVKVQSKIHRVVQGHARITLACT